MNFGLATVSIGTGAPFAALVCNDKVLALSEIAGFANINTVEAVLAQWDDKLDALTQAAINLSGKPLSEYRVHAPYVPRQVFCTGANYRKHVIDLIMNDPSMRTPTDEAVTDPVARRKHAEAMMDERARIGLPYCFIKLPSCVIGPEDDVILPRNVIKPDWELELGVVISKRTRHVKAADAMQHVAGFAIVNDLTAREHVFRKDASAIGADWLSGKCFPTFLPFGPMIVPRQCVVDPYQLNLRLAVNGRVFQDENTADMMINIERQIEYLSDRVELMPGDLICTGSPPGNGSAFGVFLKPGDVMETSITGLGAQRNRCVSEA